ncbi:MAG: YraN family protein [Bacteroidota bacterium]|jgi:putative endonuclease
MMKNKRSEGTKSEQIAENFLTKKGLKIICRNYHFGRGEIDLIFDDNGILVFVEVKSRRTDEYGEPEDAITIPKRKQIRRVAEGYLWENNIENVECRFDVVAIKWEDYKPIIKYIPNAF